MKWDDVFLHAFICISRAKPIETEADAEHAAKLAAKVADEYSRYYQERRV